MFMRYLFVFLSIMLLFRVKRLSLCSPWRLIHTYHSIIHTNFQSFFLIHIHILYNKLNHLLEFRFNLLTSKLPLYIVPYWTKGRAKESMETSYSIPSILMLNLETHYAGEILFRNKQIKKEKLTLCFFVAKVTGKV